MKKIFLFAALCSAMMVSAKQYCQETITSNDGTKTVQLSCELISGVYRITIDGENLNGFGGSFFNPGATDLRTAITSSTATQIVCDINTETAPSLYTPLYILMPGEVVFTWPNDIEWGACGEAVEDEEKPVLVSAELVSHDYQSAVIAVEATDNVGVFNYLVNEGETENFGTEVGTFMAKDGKITVTGLTPSTDYTLWIYAKDAAGNKSTAKSVTLTTDDFSYCNIPTGHLQDANFGDPAGRILLSLTKKDGNTVTVTVKPNYENGATKKLDFLYVDPKFGTPLTTGADIEDGGEDELSVDVEYVTMPDVLNFRIEWSNPGWPGRWAADITNVGIATLCSGENPSTAINTIESASVVCKRVINGQLVITIDGINYTAQGQVIK